LAKSLQSLRHKRLAEIVAKQRRAAKLTQAEAAKRLGRHQPFLANIESGQRRIDVVEFIQLAAVIKLDIHAVLRELSRMPDEGGFARAIVKAKRKGSRELLQSSSRR
jgi:transcriptional regulator with XRE-family HTH domain